MRTALTLLALTVLLSGCVSEDTREGDPHRREFPAYDGPKLVVVVVDLENQAEDNRYSELGNIGTGLLMTELGRSGSISLQGREKLDEVLKELELTASGTEDVNKVSGGAMPVRPDVLVYGKIQSFASHYETGGIPIIWVKKTQVATAKVAIFVQNTTSMELQTNYGEGRATKSTSGGAIGGSTSGYDRALAERALRLAIFDCWTRIMEQIKAVNPKKPAGE